MNAAVRIMDWSKYTLEEWLKQYGAYIQTCRMKSGNEPDNLRINQIYWLIVENNKGVATRKDQLICKISDFEADCIRKLIVDFQNSTTVCASAKRAVMLFIEKNVRGLTDRKMEDEFKLGRNVLKSMVFCGQYYLAGHDKRLRID
ncbi:hypothetical protein RFI36_04765 [Acinetobacter gerneri]|jgi:hypothetical protein|uniref:Phage antitermination protein Q n=1 Tax=Acinetobacter gerneri TaxID=202952 RepID=A0AAW8JFL6_9GAMM|nr:hypothetical protein [Acinetobacter gerneri]MCH4243734.1 hypothetical protein [Acinetobacter gerneri]MDQ9009018.1 hypothetical protein [Acinetobacter gerneri]MDQ9013122.1 hypothetical protein [Acinetobacter gerneri]MDQ9024559.1 hypothetical protein [Acinetobacter gerneri]MDQ9051794.1 hypothetical protein [Acinetobacter gerneri]